MSQQRSTKKKTKAPSAAQVLRLAAQENIKLKQELSQARHDLDEQRARSAHFERGFMMAAREADAALNSAVALQEQMKTIPKMKCVCGNDARYINQHGVLCCALCPLREGIDSIQLRNVAPLLQWARDFIGKAHMLRWTVDSPAPFDKNPGQLMVDALCDIIQKGPDSRGLLTESQSIRVGDHVRVTAQTNPHFDTVGTVSKIKTGNSTFSMVEVLFSNGHYVWFKDSSLAWVGFGLVPKDSDARKVTSTNAEPKQEIFKGSRVKVIDKDTGFLDTYGSVLKIDPSDGKILVLLQGTNDTRVWFKDSSLALLPKV